MHFKSARIVAVGAALQDIYLIDHDDFGINARGYFNQIELGSKIDIDRIFFSSGGGAINVATTFARYGHTAVFMGAIARDPAGDAVIASLDEEGIDTSFITYTDHYHTGCSVILLTPSGERSILTYRGASGHFELIDAADLQQIYPDWLYVSTLRANFSLLKRLFKTARKLGTKIMFNPGILELKQPKKLLELLPQVEVLILNRDEARQLVTGSSLPELAARIKNYAPITIITNGRQGAIATDRITAKETFRLSVYEDPPILDATGAGDAFGSGFLAAYASGKDFVSSLTFAAANSTAVVTKVGSRTAILSRQTRLHAFPISPVR